MTEIISVRFRNGGKEYYFDPRGIRVETGDNVIVETSKGPEFALCSRGNTTVEDSAVVQPLRPLLRLADERDLATLRRNQEREREALRICEEKVAEYKLDMDLVRCECSFDGSKLLFLFISEGRVDFRALVKDLAASLHSRIELHQIGVRDETKLLGGLGICGRPYCCNAFLDQFQPVGIKMAKTQGLSLNPAKISGACGRLMCCLNYEQAAYEDAVKRMPKGDSFVETPDGVGDISSVDYLRETVQVRLDNAPEEPHTYAPEEINVVRSGKGRRPEGYVAPAPEVLEKLRKTPRQPVFQEQRSLLDHIISPAGEPSPEAPAKGRSPSQRRASAKHPGEAKGKPTEEAKAPQEQPAGETPSAARTAHRRRHRGGRFKQGGSGTSKS